MGIVFIYKVVISWSNKKQHIISIFTTKAKYIAFRYEVLKNVYIRQFVNKLKVVNLIGAYIFYGNNKISIILIKKLRVKQRQNILI